MCERLKQAVLNTAIPERVSESRIPLPPPVARLKEGAPEARNYVTQRVSAGKACDKNVFLAAAGSRGAERAEIADYQTHQSKAKPETQGRLRLLRGTSESSYRRPMRSAAFCPLPHNRQSISSVLEVDSLLL